MTEELVDFTEPLQKLLKEVKMPTINNFYISVEAYVTDGVMNIPNREGLRASLRALPNDTKLKLELSVYDEKKEENRRRTEQQNKYYHKLLDIISEHTGDTHMDLHNNLKAEFLSRPWVKGEKEYLLVKSTKELTSKEFSSFIERVFQWATTEYGINLPDSSGYY